MDLIAYLRILRRRWPLVLVPALGALLISWGTLPAAEEAVPTARSYSATATLIISPNAAQSGQSPLDLSTVALFSTLGEVPERAAEAIGYAGEAQVLAAQVVVSAVPETGTLTISSTDTDADAVSERVNAFARATVDYFRDNQQSVASSRIEALNLQLERTTEAIRSIQRKLRRLPEDPILQSQLQALQNQYSMQFGEVNGLNQQLGGPGPIDLLQKAVAVPQISDGFSAPTDASARLAIAGLLGLLLGGALALVIERIDSRLRTREQVEEAFGLPVLAEVPAVPYAQRREREVVSAVRPASASAEAYRSLRSAVLLLGPESGSLPGTAIPNGGPLVVLVTSALPGEGKTTTVVNLAAVMAEAGRRVLVLSFDLRSPRLHEFLDVDNGTGISDLLAADCPDRLAQVVRRTNLSGVDLVTSGQQVDHPGALLASGGPLIEAARQMADVVLVDTAPMLAVSDAVDLAQHVDVALVVSRLNRTTNAQAAATQRLLSRLGVPALGTVLVGSRPTGAHDPYRYPDRSSEGAGSVVREEAQEQRETVARNRDEHHA